MGGGLHALSRKAECRTGYLGVTEHAVGQVPSEAKC